MKGATMSAGFTLDADQRAAFIAAARTKIASEGDAAERPAEPMLSSDGPRARLGVLALFQSPAKAQAATATLVAAGIPERAIRLVVALSDPEDGNAGAGASPPDDPLRDRLGTIGVAPEALDACCAALRQGAALLKLVVADAQRDRVLSILNDHSSVDPTLRLATWSAEGWRHVARLHGGLGRLFRHLDRRNRHRDAGGISRWPCSLPSGPRRPTSTPCGDTR